MKPRKLNTILFTLFLSLTASVVTGCNNGAVVAVVIVVKKKAAPLIGPINLQSKPTKQRIRI